MNIAARTAVAFIMSYGGAAPARATSAPHLGEPKPSAAPGERQRGPAPGERSEPLHLREAQPSAGTCGER